MGENRLSEKTHESLSTSPNSQSEDAVYPEGKARQTLVQILALAFSCVTLFICHQ